MLHRLFLCCLITLSACSRLESGIVGVWGSPDQVIEFLPGGAVTLVRGGLEFHGEYAVVENKYIRFDFPGIPPRVVAASLLAHDSLSLDDGNPMIRLTAMPPVVTPRMRAFRASLRAAMQSASDSMAAARERLGHYPRGTELPLFDSSERVFLEVTETGEDGYVLVGRHRELDEECRLWVGDERTVDPAAPDRRWLNKLNCPDQQH